MHTKSYRIVEFILIFVVIPLSFSLHYSVVIKFCIGAVGFVYVLYVLLHVERETFTMTPNLNWKKFWKTTLLKFSIIVAITTFYVWSTNVNALFKVMLNTPGLWFFILIVYAVVSVYPQELLYRTFFFKRYDRLFNNSMLIIFLNALVFALAHTLFKNMLVLSLTFLGGLSFAFTFKNSHSTLMVTIEHALYGCWLFTVGMGEMLGFPT